MFIFTKCLASIEKFAILLARFRSLDTLVLLAVEVGGLTERSSQQLAGILQTLLQSQRVLGFVVEPVVWMCSPANNDGENISPSLSPSPVCRVLYRILWQRTEELDLRSWCWERYEKKVDSEESDHGENSTLLVAAVAGHGDTVPLSSPPSLYNITPGCHASQTHGEKHQTSSLPFELWLRFRML